MSQKESKLIRVTGQEIVDSARNCLGYKWSHQRASRKDRECDCIGMIKLIIEDHNLNYSWRGNYERVPQNEEMLKELRAHLIEIPLDEIQHGDIIAFKLKGTVTHIGVYCNDKEYSTLIHSDLRPRKVVEVTYHPVFANIAHSAYRFKEVVSYARQEKLQGN